MRAQAKRAQAVVPRRRGDPHARRRGRTGEIISTCYRYLHEAIDVIAEQTPDLHDVHDRATREGWSHATLDGTLIEIDRDEIGTHYARIVFHC